MTLCCSKGQREIERNFASVTRLCLGELNPHWQRLVRRKCVN